MRIQGILHPGPLVATLDTSLGDLHAAVGAFLASADRALSQWRVARQPGKWTPAQVVEHVALIMEESAKVAAGLPSHFPTLPRFLRPVIRLLVFRRILKRGEFLRMSAADDFQPSAGPLTPADGHVRLDQALTAFTDACRTSASEGHPVRSTLFGPVPIADFVRFQELHVRHHLPQLSIPASLGGPVANH